MFPFTEKGYTFVSPDKLEMDFSNYLKYIEEASRILKEILSVLEICEGLLRLMILERGERFTQW